MKLADLAKKPQLIKITIDDELTVKEFGEPLEFYTWDRQPLDTFLNIANATGRELGAMIEGVKDLVLDEAGEKIIKDGLALPSHILVRVINKIVDNLGK